MSSQQFDEEAVFHIARKLDDLAYREKYLNQICAGDVQLRERVEALLDVHEKEAEFLKSSPEAVPTVDHTPLTESPGTTIGRYHLREQIGEGGMGTVFVAEQERPIRRKVALKVIKPGMDSKAVVARFEAERQALALMDHPNIAKVLDAGTTETGRPYFAMELVRGIPITEYCDQHKLNIRERLELFIQVCEAIQHAHQKAIIHRDIKPTNVLVTEQDGKAVPKVIDFGVAKALNQRLTERTIYTTFAQVVGTPLYMSPEQAALSAVDVDTRSDVYSLGVLLYELLTGTTPFDRQRFETAAYDEIRRIVREEEPPKPSTKISTMGDLGSAAAQNRRTDREKLGRALQGDLDWIAMKSIDKDRTRRYETTASLAADVRRFMDDQPVHARPPSGSYRLRKFVRRNRSAVVATVILASALIIALAGLGVGFSRASSEAARANAVLGKYHNMLIEVALLHAVLGDIEYVEAVVDAIEDPLFPEDWHLTLKGVAHLHGGDNRRAIEELESALKRNSGNISAKAMLSLAYFHNGDWEKWFQHVASLRSAVPRPEYSDFDELFLGYAWFYMDSRESAERLRAVSDRHPTWVFPRMMFASALAHRASFEDDEQLMEQALNGMKVPVELADDNLFISMQCLHVHSNAISIFRDRTAEFDRIAKRFSDQLDAYPQYVVGSLVRGIYYDRTGRLEKAKQAWYDVLEHGSGMLVHWPAAELLRAGLGHEITARQWSEREAQIARAYVLALSSHRAERDEARQVYETLTPTANTWFVRHLLIQIPLLLRDPAEAQAQSVEWIEVAADDVDLIGGSWERESIEFLADTSKPRFDANSADLNERFFANLQMALWSYSQGHIEDARAQLEMAPSDSGGFWRSWAKAFHEEFARQKKEQDSSR